MLTADLVRATLRQGRVRPTFVKPGDAALREAAEEMVAAVEAAQAARAPRRVLQEALDEAIGPSRRAKVLKGFAKLLVDRCTFETASEIPPRTVRDTVFRLAAERGPLALEAGPTGRPVAADVLAEAGASLGMTAVAVSEALYADLPSEQVIVEARPWPADQLADRYNLALVQAVVLHAEEVTLTLEGPTPARLRQLMHHARFCRLMVGASREGATVTLTLDGPGSVLKRSTAYGLDLARFVAGVPRLDVPWTLTAPVRWGRAKRHAVLELDHTAGLRSHLRDAGGQAAPEVTRLVARWPTDHPFQPSDEVLPIPLGGRGLLLPDLAFSDGERTAYLEVAGWWRRDWLDRHLEGLARHGRKDVIVAVSRRMCVDRKVEDLPVRVVTFGEVLPLKALRDAVSEVAS